MISHTNIAITVITAVCRGAMLGSIANFCWATKPPVIDATVVDALMIPTLFPVEQIRTMFSVTRGEVDINIKVSKKSNTKLFNFEVSLSESFLLYHLSSTH